MGLIISCAPEGSLTGILVKETVINLDTSDTRMGECINCNSIITTPELLLRCYYNSEYTLTE